MVYCIYKEEHMKKIKDKKEIRQTIKATAWQIAKDSGYTHWRQAVPEAKEVVRKHYAVNAI